MKQVPNIAWMSLEEAKTHFNKLPDLVRVISTPMSSKLYCIVPREFIGYAIEFYGNNVEVICESDIQIQPEELFKLNENVPFWQQINKRKRR